MSEENKDNFYYCVTQMDAKGKPNNTRANGGLFYVYPDIEGALRQWGKPLAKNEVIMRFAFDGLYKTKVEFVKVEVPDEKNSKDYIEKEDGTFVKKAPKKSLEQRL